MIRALRARQANKLTLYDETKYHDISVPGKM